MGERWRRHPHPSPLQGCSLGFWEGPAWTGLSRHDGGTPPPLLLHRPRRWWAQPDIFITTYLLQPFSGSAMAAWSDSGYREDLKGPHQPRARAHRPELLFMPGSEGKILTRHGPPACWFGKAPRPRASAPPPPGSGSSQALAPGQWNQLGEAMRTGKCRPLGHPMLPLNLRSAGSGRWPLGSGVMTGPLTASGVGEGGSASMPCPLGRRGPGPRS